MMMTSFYKRLFASLFFSFPGLVLAQGGDGDTFDQTQIITGDRTLSVQKAFKISELPSPVEIPVKLGDLKYELVPKRPTINISLDTIEPAKVKVREPLDKLYRGFVKAGAGTFATPYVEAFYTSERNRDLAYGVHLRHLSANDGVNRPVAYSGFSQNALDVWGKKIFKKHSLEAGIGYNRDMVHYYGFDPQDADIDKKDYRQHYNLINFDADWKSYYRDSSKVNHDIGLSTYILNDRYDAGEFGINATADLRTFRGNQYYTLKTGFDFISYSADALRPFGFLNDTSGIVIPKNENNNAIFHLTPNILLTKGGLRASVGIGIYGRFSNQARFHAFPDIEVSYSLFNDIFIPYAGITGSVERTGFRTLSRENPFIMSNLNLLNEINRYNVFGGFRGSISDNISFNAGVSYTQTDQMALFVNDTLVSIENRINVIYDDVSTFRLLGELSYNMGAKWSATARAEIFAYSADVEAEAWHLPKYRYALIAEYNLFDKFVIGANMSLIGPRPVKSLLPVSDTEPEAGVFTKLELDPYFDLSLSAEYRYTTRLSAFIEGHNLTGSKYEIFYRFPAQRVFVLGGLKYAF